jgi:hypothetical protein
LKLYNNEEIIGKLIDVEYKNQTLQLVLKIEFDNILEIPICYDDEFKIFKGEKIGILSIDGHYFIRKIKSTSDEINVVRSDLTKKGGDIHSDE